MPKASPPGAGFQRAAAAPPLPASTFGFIAYFARQFRWPLLLMVVLEAGQAASNILVPYAIGQIINRVTQNGLDPVTLLETLREPLLLYVALNVGEVLFSRASGAVLIMTGPLIRRRVSRSLFAYLQYHSHRYFSANFAGALAHRITETSTSVNHTLWTILFDFWPIAIDFAVAVVMLAFAHAELAWFVGTWAAAFTLLSYWLATRCQPYAQRFAGVRSEVNGKIVDAVTNMTNARLFARLDYERQRLEGTLTDELGEAKRTYWYMERVRWFQFLASLFLKVGTLYYALRLWSEGKIEVGDFAMAASLSVLIISESRNLSRRFLEFFEYMGNVANGVQVIVRPHDVIDLPDAAPFPIMQGRVEFKNITFGYLADQPVFRDLNVVIEPGQRVGLVGFSGSGKSTFINLLMRLYDPQDGAVLVDGMNIRHMSLDSLHAQVGLIPQDPTLFHRTLAENIRFGRVEAQPPEIKEAARRAHAHEFIQSMREAYDALVGERGVKLSGGQRQRIAIARVVLKDAPILVMDEATSSLDSVTERAIQDSLEDLMRGKTVIVVAHRLSTIAHLDRILVFDQGRIVEDGSHAELLGRGGAYAKLWNMQAGGFLPEGENAANGGSADHA